MAIKKKWGRRDIPPCPDPEQYILVKTAERPYWRRKRGSVKPAVLNTAFAANAANTKLTSPATVRLLERLRPYLTGLTTGRLKVQVEGGLRKALNADGNMNYRFLEGLDLQPRYPLPNLLRDTPKVVVAEGFVQTVLDLEGGAVKRHSPLVTHWWAEAVLVWGDPLSDGLRVDSTESPLYAFADTSLTECRLEMDLPAVGHPWMLLLKVSCLEGHELAVSSRHYGMRVVKAG
jgi:hypothetical protein